MEVLLVALKCFDFIHQFIIFDTFAFYFIYRDQLGAEFCLETKKISILSALRRHFGFFMCILIYSYVFYSNLDNFINKR